MSERWWMKWLQTCYFTNDNLSAIAQSIRGCPLSCHYFLTNIINNYLFYWPSFNIFVATNKIFGGNWTILRGLSPHPIILFTRRLKNNKASVISVSHQVVAWLLVLHCTMGLFENQLDSNCFRLFIQNNSSVWLLWRRNKNKRKQSYDGWGWVVDGLSMWQYDLMTIFSSWWWLVRNNTSHESAAESSNIWRQEPALLSVTKLNQFVQKVRFESKCLFNQCNLIPLILGQLAIPI